MKRLIAFLLLVFIPTFCLGDMVGYSGDKRRYVTDEEKSQFPYNTVVKINGDDNPGTGTFVSKDIILTCRHVVDTVSDEEYINYYAPNGQQHSGIVKYGKGSKPDIGFIVDINAFSGNVLGISPVAKHSNNLMIVGYDSLKPLSDEELKIIKDTYRDWLSENGGKITTANAYKSMAEIDVILRTQYNCTSENQKNCVRCSGEWCIFDDANNMKVRDGCKVVSIDSSIYMDCPAAPGASGSAVIDKDTMQIIGVACSIMQPQIGQNKDALSNAVKPEAYYNTLNTLINIFNE